MDVANETTTEQEESGQTLSSEADRQLETQSGDGEKAALDIPEQFMKDGSPDVQALFSSYQELQAFREEINQARSGIPESADGYEFALPEGFEAPQGFAFNPDDDPRFAELREAAKEIGLTKEQFSQIVGIDVKHAAEAHKQAQGAARQEIEKLGADGANRVKTTFSRVEASLGKDAADVLRAQIVTAEGFLAVEKLLQRSNGSRPQPSAQQQGTGLEDLEKMKPGDRFSVLARRKQA